MVVIFNKMEYNEDFHFRNTSKPLNYYKNVTNFYWITFGIWHRLTDLVNKLKFEH